MSVIEANVSKDFLTGSVVVGTDPVQLTDTSFDCKRGVIVKADQQNTGIGYVGNSDVTPGTTPDTDGFPLAAGESQPIPINNPNKLFIIATDVAQTYYFIAV